MYKSGLALVLSGLLAETPQDLASMGIFGAILPSHLPGSSATQDLACIGFGLCAYGLYRMSRAKGRSGWPSLLGVLGVPGALAGIVVVSLFKQNNASTPRAA